jgi:tyrosinase
MLPLAYLCPISDLLSVRINIGPVFPEMDTVVPNPGGPMAPNPRCLRRDLSSFVLSKWMTTANLLNVTVGDASKSIGAMQTELQGRFPDGFLGMHASGHAAVGGEASDIFTSPNDPSFFLHHAMVDRVYWIWQVLHPTEATEIAGTVTINNNPPSRDTLKTDAITMGPNAVTRPIEQLLNTLGGTPLCYVYL